MRVLVVEDSDTLRASLQTGLAREGFAVDVAADGELGLSYARNNPYDVLVLDPPRQGARALFEESKVLPGPKRVVYVSCDTATLSRDLRMATERGYRVDRMIAFDMFPQTAHLESLVRLVRA